jgi:hypothetical protein
MLQQQQQNSDNVGGGGEDEEEGDQHEVNKRDVYMVENKVENNAEHYEEVVEQHEVIKNIVNVDNPFDTQKDRHRQQHDNLQRSSYNSELEGLANLYDEGLTSLSGLSELTSFTDVLKSFNRTKRSSTSSTAGSVCAPVRLANP